MAERGWNMKMTGIKDLERMMLKELPAATNRRVMLSAMRASAKPMVLSAQAKAKKQSGALARSIGLKTIRNRSGNKTYAQMTLSPTSGNLDVWAQYMTYHKRKVSVKGKGGKVDANKPGRIRHGHLVEFGFRHTSGKMVKARPFLRPAFDEQAGTYVNTFQGHLKAKIDNAVSKARKGK